MDTAFTGTRHPVEAGRFYPGSPERLASDIAGYLAEGHRAHRSPARAIIAPHAGYAYSGATAGQAYGCLAGAPCRRIVLMTPSHYVPFAQLSVGTYAGLETPVGNVSVDVDGCRRLLSDPLFVARTDTHREEHALGTHLPFIATVFPDVPVIPIVCGQLDEPSVEHAAEVLAEAFPETDTLWIASSDFTHFGRDFGFAPFSDHVHARIEELDHEGIDRILALDGRGFGSFLERTGATICGADPIRVLIGVLDRLGVGTGERIGYTSSGRMMGDERHSVSYAAICFGTTAEEEPFSLTDREEEVALSLARRAIASDLFGTELEIPKDLPEGLLQDGACFVTLTIDGNLRGCIGEMQPSGRLVESIIRNARSAAFGDWRFTPLTAPEFEQVHLEISVLSPLRRIDGPEEFIVGTHGIWIEKGRHRAVFLPQVAPEQGWDRVTTLEHLCRKAGMEANAWQRGTTFKVFTAHVFEEAEG
jgi:AmmeMemoRadiSam system protein B/AmmeMemoRadiSam system protein A